MCSTLASSLFAVFYHADLCCSSVNQTERMQTGAMAIAACHACGATWELAKCMGWVYLMCATGSAAQRWLQLVLSSWPHGCLSVSLKYMMSSISCHGKLLCTTACCCWWPLRMIGYLCERRSGIPQKLPRSHVGCTLACCNITSIFLVCELAGPPTTIVVQELAQRFCIGR